MSAVTGLGIESASFRNGLPHESVLEMDILTGTGEVIEESLLADGLKEVVLLIDWREPLHVVVVVDDVHREERVVTVYEPASDRWSDDYRRRR